MKHFCKLQESNHQLLSATAIVVVLCAVLTNSADAVTSSGQAEAAIISLTTPALSPIDNLNFGEIITSGGPGTVTISTAGAPTLSGVSLTGGSPHQQGVMRILGNPSAQVDVNIVPGAYFVTNGAVTMPVTAFDLGAGANNPALVTIGGGGTYDLNIGATLGVSAGQQAGTYTGTFTVNADYN